FAAQLILRRQGLVVGVLLFLVGLLVLSSFVWSVEVSGLETLPPDVVLQGAARLGLRPGVLKRSVDHHRVETGLVLEVREISWAGLAFNGTRAILKVVEKALPPAEPPANTPAHIIASKAGLLTDVMVLKGTGLAEAGQTVSQGQIIISGLIGLSAEEQLGLVKPRELPGGLPPWTALVHATGIVRARVWYRGHGEALLTKYLRNRTGQVATRILIKIGGQEIIVKGQGDVPFGEYDTEVVRWSLPVWRNITIPVEVIMTTFHQVTLAEKSVAAEVAEQEARENAIIQAMTKVPSGVRILGVQSSATSNDGKVSVDVVVETIEDIGQAEPVTR
ncbi:MAG: sporulation protein YqfD, partial [Bacillota bacterium]